MNASESRAHIIEWLVERALDWLLDARIDDTRNGLHISPMFFDGAEILDADFTDVTHGEHNDFVFQDVTPDVLTRPLDVRIIRPTDDVHPDLSVQRWRAVTMREIRGRVHPILPHPIELTVAFPELHDATRQHYGRVGRLRWAPMIMNPHMHGLRDGAYEQHSYAIDDTGASEKIQLALGMQFTRRYQWRVYFGLDGRPGVELPTDPIGAREAFRLRDIPAGRDRRVALRHWVHQHWRKLRVDPVEETKVREHLRGASDFHWSGLHCRVTPSEFDQERTERARVLREHERFTGEDRRLAPPRELTVKEKYGPMSAA